jgi:hypothetical protein
MVDVVRNPRRLALDWCADNGYPEAEGRGRHRIMAEHEMFSQGPPGLNAPMGTPRDGALFLLSTIVSPSIKKAPQEVSKFGAFPLVKARTNPSLVHGESIPLGTPLLDALAECLERCGSHSELRMVSLQADRAVRPAAELVLGLFKDGSDKPSRTLTLTFMPTTPVAAESQKKPIEYSSRLLSHALTSMADLLAPNIAAANRAFFAARGSGIFAEFRYENGPSVDADEPLPSDVSPRAAKPETQSDNLEASAGSIKYQSADSSEACGRSSDDSLSSEKDQTNADDDRPDRPSPCAA